MGSTKLNSAWVVVGSTKVNSPGAVGSIKRKTDGLIEVIVQIVPYPYANGLEGLFNADHLPFGSEVLEHIAVTVPSSVSPAATHCCVFACQSIPLNRPPLS